MIQAIRRRNRGEEGMVLPLALAFLVVFGVTLAVIFGFASTSFLSTNSVRHERDSLYAASGAVDAAIQYARTHPEVGKSGETCASNPNAFSVPGIDSNNVVVCRDANSTSGDPLPSTTEPGFAILTTAPFTHYWNQNNPQTCSTISTAAGAEVGILQFQKSKLLKVTGNVYVNSDVDADVWLNGCPQVFDAKAINVAGKVKVRESCHDIFALQGYTWNCDQNGQTDSETQADATAAGRNPPTPNGGQPANDADLVDPGLDPQQAASWAPMITAPPAAATMPAVCDANTPSVIAFSPGTYTDAAALSAYTSGTCQNRVLWFQPGVYYFDFNNGGDVWNINDGTTRIVGGKPNGVASPAQTVLNTTWDPTGNTSTAFTPLSYVDAQGKTIPITKFDGHIATATPKSATAQTITASGFNTDPPSALAGNVQINAVRLTVVHAEAAGFAAPTVTITPSGGSPCAAVPLPQHTTMTPDVVNIDTTTCLNSASKLSGGTGVSIQYSATCASCNSSNTAITSQLDGMQLSVDYTIPARPAWDGTPASVDASSPSIPGSCRHDGDSGWGVGDGVQFVFGGDSHVNLTAGRLELCDMRTTGTQQEIVVYGVRAVPTPSPQPTGWLVATNPPAPTTSSPNGFSTPLTNALTINGSTSGTGNFSGSGATRWIRVGGYTVPANNQVPTGSTNIQVGVKVAHQESTTSSTINNVQVQVRDPADTTTLCSFNVTKSTSLTTATLANAPCTGLTPAMINAGSNGGFLVRYQIQHCSSGGTCSTTTNVSTSLDGIQIQVTYTPPPTGTTGTLKPQSGCVTQAPYYNLTDHTPGANGACALIRVAGSTTTGAPQCDTSHVCATFWGTVYAPSAALDIQPDVLPVSVFGRGVVARMLMLGYNIQSDALVPISTAPISTGGTHPREMTITASIPNKPTKVVAQVCFADFPAGQTQASESCVDGTRSVAPPGSAGSPSNVLVKSWTVTR